MTPGAPASRLMVTDWIVLPPALDAAHVLVMPAVSDVTATGAHSVDTETGPSGSVTVQLNMTSLVYQPSEPSVPDTVGMTSGGVRSTTTVVMASECETPAAMAVLRRPAGTSAWPESSRPQATTEPSLLSANEC